MATAVSTCHVPKSGASANSATFARLDSSVCMCHRQAIVEFRHAPVLVCESVFVRAVCRDPVLAMVSLRATIGIFADPILLGSSLVMHLRDKVFQFHLRCYSRARPLHVHFRRNLESDLA